MESPFAESDSASLFDDVYPEEIFAQDPDDAATLPGMQTDEYVVGSDETEAEGVTEAAGINEAENEAGIETENIADTTAETEDETEAETEAETEPLFAEEEPLLSASAAIENWLAHSRDYSHGSHSPSGRKNRYRCILPRRAPF